MRRLKTSAGVLLVILGLVAVASVIKLIDIETRMGPESAVFARIPFVVALMGCGCLVVAPLISIVSRQSWNQFILYFLLGLNLLELLFVVGVLIWAGVVTSSAY